MNRSCIYCGQIHPREYVCPKKPPKKLFRKNKAQKEKFRSTSAWQKKRAAVFSRDGGLCQWCLHSGGRYTAGAEVHHIVPLVEDFGQRLDGENLITLCVRCHKQADNGEIPWEKLRELAIQNEDRNKG